MLVPDPLAPLLVASGRGDAAAFASLYQSASPRIFGLVSRILRDVHQSEEVTQEVFLEVWRTAGRFDPDRGSGRSWLMTLAHRRAVDRVRSSQSAHRRDAAEAQLGRPTPFDQTLEAAQASLEAQRVRTALVGLPTVQRQAIELAYFGGHTHSEVSTLLGVPLGTAKTRIRNGLVRLRELLAVPTPEPV